LNDRASDGVATQSDLRSRRLSRQVVRSAVVAATLSIGLPVRGDSLIPGQAAQAGALGRPRLTAVRLDRTPVIDGKLDDNAWAAVPVTSNFTQKFPREGQLPEEKTHLRVAYDEHAVFIALECEQVLAPITSRMTRRDRIVESDWVSVAIDTRQDGRGGFEFTVSAAGVLADSIRFDDTLTSSDWDENWDARTHIGPNGWSAEYRIPLRILRFASIPIQTWGFQARRHVSARQETDEWAPISRRSAGEVSQYGRLEAMKGLESSHGIELVPFFWTRYLQRDPRPGLLAYGSERSAAVGLELKWHPSQDFTLDAAVLPDFGQVETDQVILNLTNLETSYPEKRRFFTEGIDTFATPVLPLLYTRRIGRRPGPPALRPDEQLVDLPKPSPLYGALKLAGRYAGSWEVGGLAAVTGPNEVELGFADGTRVQRTIDPLSSFNVLRLKKVVGGNGHIGITGTSVVRFEDAGDSRAGAGAGLAETKSLCPNGVEVPAGSRCSNDAYAAGVDWRWRSPSGDYVTTGQYVGSVLQHGPSRPLPDGTVVAPGDVGQSLRLELNKEGGAHWLWNTWAAADGRKLEVNDLSFLDRGNVIGFGGDLSYRTLEPLAGTLETATKVLIIFTHNFDSRPLERTVLFQESARFANFWSATAGAGFLASHFDDREVGDGAALERAGRTSLSLKLETDPRGKAWARLNGGTELLSDARNYHADFTVSLNVLSQLDIEITPQLIHARGEPRYVSTEPGGEYVFGRLAATSADVTLRATYAFTPRLTFDAYTQMFAVAKQYSDFSSPGRVGYEHHPAIRLKELRTTAPPTENPDVQDGIMNVNFVLRWEFRPGCPLYLVYRRSQVPHAALRAGEEPKLDFRSVQRGATATELLLKLAYWWDG
jgi:hypothetical protein